MGIASNASSREITSAYRRLALQYHPDRNKTPLANDMMLRINTSYSILSDPNKRRDYDATRNKAEIQYTKYDSKPKTVVFNESNTNKGQKGPNNPMGRKYIKYGLIALLTLKFIILELRKWMQRIF
ncbi:MAG: J domain-containing protein [Candidatus Nitrosocosmicus sp.]|nr:J domain-containing protein [Candidatus Nitrosocosmicus sp.]